MRLGTRNPLLRTLRALVSCVLRQAGGIRMNCKQGDLAVITKSVDGINVGKIVECLYLAGIHSKLGPIWHVRSAGNDLITEYGAVGPECDCADDWLKPLPPPANDEHFDVPHELTA